MSEIIKKIALVFILLAALTMLGFFMSFQRQISVFTDNEDNPISEDRLSFLLLGKTGRAIGWSNAPDLADSIILIDYRPQIGVANMVSLPRDLYVTLGNESFKLNEVLRRKKMPELLEVLPQITGIKTDKYIVVNVDTLKKVVDELGGIDIALNEKAVDAVSGYTIPVGQQRLNGEQTVWLSRNRYSPEGDFFREKNQQEIVRAIIKKFKGMSTVEKTAFLFKMTPELGNLDTNIDIAKLLPTARKFNGVRINNIVIDFKSGILQSSEVQYGEALVYILVPRLGQGKYDELREFIAARVEK